MSDFQKRLWGRSTILRGDAASRTKNTLHDRFKNPIARKVKIADLEDNMDLKRIETIRWKELSRLGQYYQAWKRLKGKEE